MGGPFRVAQTFLSVKSWERMMRDNKADGDGEGGLVGGGLGRPVGIEINRNWGRRSWSGPVFVGIVGGRGQTEMSAPPCC